MGDTMTRVHHAVASAALAATAIVGCKSPIAHNLPPAERLMHPGPGVGGPGPGVMLRGSAGPPGGPAVTAESQVWFVRPEGMTVRWDVLQPGSFDSEPLIVPGRQNFPQGAIYRLKLTNIPGREGMELYPTIEIGPATPRTDGYLAHSPIPAEFTEEDFDQVQSGNYVVKVLYLPDPEFQELALAGVETLVSTRLDPGVDPIVEADRRGSILAIIRLGNKDLELPGMAGETEYVVPASHQSASPVRPASDSSPADVAPVEMSSGDIQFGETPIGLQTGAFVPPAAAPHQIAQATAPPWGMPISGTPIGLPGPPHVPLGVPAGLRRHVVKNHTKRHIPHPTRRVKINVKQRPGFSYPKPPSHVWIRETVKAPWKAFFVPWGNHREIVK